MGPAQSIIDVLEACQGVDSIACSFFLPACKGGLSHSHYDVSRLQALPCTKEQHLLGMACRDGWDARSVGPSVTHLRVHLPASSMSTMFPSPNDPIPLFHADNEDDEAAGWDHLARLPSLTHLAIVYRPSQRYPITTVFEHLQRLLAPPPASEPTLAPAVPARPVGGPALQLILVQVVGTSLGPSPAIDELNRLAVSSSSAADSRSALRIVAERAPMSAAVQWEEAVREGRTVWQSAEDVVATRLAVAASRASHSRG
ncbi:hypothetical protein EIP91_006115 [Steccherinum ochraceum]|uniref:Uncharacterized protein n=1 Tax=Steccherinum ochraceum TaxID=92696 RepID=A0A4R0RRH3_9APHY|nr:hypothetical protein EIP91_006115 [Steccherinum ochraceum]